jgi:multidrug efflux pump subunit AcrB
MTTSKKKKQIAGWVLSGLIAIALAGPSAMGKFTEWDGKAEMFEHLGYTNDLIVKIGVLEIALAVLFLVPRTSFLAAILLTGYLGGAVATHVRVGDPFFAPIIMGVVMWIGLALRTPGIFALAAGAARGCRASPAEGNES